jgi:hypothetical protein
VSNTVLDDPSLFLRIYRLTMKVREILRIQTFCPPEAQTPDAASLVAQYQADREKLLADLKKRFNESEISY